MTYKLSPSTLSLMEECPKCFWLHFNKKIKRPDSIFPSLPSGIDKILKEHFDKFRDKGELPPELKEKDDFSECTLFDDAEKLKEWRNNFKGIQYLDEESGSMLRGAVDNILVKDNKLIVLDYKTRGYPLKEDTHKHYQNQLDIYNFLLRKNGYETEDYAYLLFYYPEEVNENGEFAFNNEIVKLKVSVKNAESIFKKAIDILSGEMPEATERCGFCEWVEKLK